MIDNRFKDDLKEIADTLGYEEQSLQLIEEMAELTQAINKYRRYNNTESLLNIIEELADVSICIEQVKYLLNNKVFKETKSNIDVHIKGVILAKINRTKKRISECGKNLEEYYD